METTVVNLADLIGELADAHEAIYGRAIIDAHRRGDASKGEVLLITEARAVIERLGSTRAQMLVTIDRPTHACAHCEDGGADAANATA